MSAVPAYLRDPVGFFGERLRAARGFDQPSKDVRLSYRRIYILPTRAGLGFGLILMAMLLGSMNYSLSLGYILTFLLAGMGLASMLHTFGNLNRLKLEVGRADPVYAGETAIFHVLAQGSGGGNRSVWVKPAGASFEPARLDLAPREAKALRLRVSETHRGRLRLGRIALMSEYPVGLFHAWSWINLDMECLIYPAPYPRALPLPPARGRGGATSGAMSGRGTDDFQGLREYVPGDSMRHIHWKALARGQGLMTKEFAGLSDSSLWLRLQDAPVPDLEGQLSVLTRWVVDAHAADEVYGLDLGQNRIPPNRGDAHMHACLAALALHGKV